MGFGIEQSWQKMKLKIRTFSLIIATAFLALLFSSYLLITDYHDRVLHNLSQETTQAALSQTKGNQPPTSETNSIEHFPLDSFLLNLTIHLLLFLLLLLVTLVFIRIKILRPFHSFKQSFHSLISKHPGIARKTTNHFSVDNFEQELTYLVETTSDNIKKLNFSHQLGGQGWFDMDPINNKILISEEYASLLGYKANELSSNINWWKTRIHPEDIEPVVVAFIKTLKYDKPVSQEFRIKNKNDEYIWLSSVGQTVERNHLGQSTRIVAVQKDITQAKQIELRESVRVKVLELLVNAAPLDEILTAVINILEQVDPSLICSILLLDKEQKRAITAASCRLPHFYNEAINGLKIGPNEGSCGAAMHSGQRVIAANIKTHPNWEKYKALAEQAGLAACWSEPIIGSEDAVLGAFAIYHTSPCEPKDVDFTQIEFVSKLAAVAIERSKFVDQIQLFSRVFSDTHEAIIITDPAAKIVEVNPAFCIITGYERAEVIGQNPSLLSSGKHNKKFFKDMWNSVVQHGHWQGEVWNCKKNGELYIELLSISSLNDEQGNTLNYVGVFSDITATIKQQEELKLMAHYDVLTQLPNRTLFTDRFHQAIAHSKRTNKKLAVCFLDLDNFKPINDQYGHDVGDRLLIEVSRRLSEQIRSEDTVSRQGGDEFTLLLGDIDDYDVCSQSLQRILDSLSKPFMLEGRQLLITASCGVTLYPDDDADIDTLLRHADHAMYQAKLIGKNRFKIFNTEKNLKRITRHHRLAEIEQALLQDQLVLYYQPKVNMRTGEFYGVEALIRWRHPDKGLIPPLDFLPIIEGTPIEIQIGEWVISSAIAQMKIWKSINLDLEVSVNISSHHLQSANFIKFLSNKLADNEDINPKKLQLEILENSVLGDLAVISDTLRTCQESLGVSIALDDFGTGYSSLTHMRNLPTNTIKIDQSFVRDVLDDPSDYVIVNGVIGLAESFERKVIAEGVESTEHGLILLMMGCELAQGYEIAKPMPANEIYKWSTGNIANDKWLSWGKQTHTELQSKIALFELTCSWWKNHFVTNILLDPTMIRDWPIMDNRQCHCGRWIERAKREKIFEQTLIYQLDIFHKQIHAIANDLRSLYEAGECEQARKGLADMESTFEDMQSLLVEYIESGA